MSGLSILFAKESLELLKAGNDEDALSICESGTAAFPEYPAGWLMLANVYFERGDLDKARDATREGLKDYPDYLPLVNFSKVIDDTKIITDVAEELSKNKETETDSVAEKKQKEQSAEKIIDIIEEKVNKSETRKTSFLRLVKTYESNEVNENQLRADNPALIPGLTFTPLRATRRKQADDFRNQPLRFPEMYNPIERNENEEQNGEDINGNLYATDTMAGILEAQGALNQAIEIYQMLIKVNPDKADFYKNKINELKLKLND